ncbi:unnamed protein product, partial [Urochloa humidicola]
GAGPARGRAQGVLTRDGGGAARRPGLRVTAADDVRGAWRSGQRPLRRPRGRDVAVATGSARDIPGRGRRWRGSGMGRVPASSVLLLADARL